MITTHVYLTIWSLSDMYLCVCMFNSVVKLIWLWLKYVLIHELFTFQAPQFWRKLRKSFENCKPEESTDQEKYFYHLTFSRCSIQVSHCFIWKAKLLFSALLAVPVQWFIAFRKKWRRLLQVLCLFWASTVSNPTGVLITTYPIIKQVRSNVSNLQELVAESTT